MQQALSEFKRSLTPGGFVVLTCPDLESACAMIADDLMIVGAKTSPAGDLPPLDIMYGHRPAMARGNLYVARRCCFTQKVLIATFQQAGFKKMASTERGHPYYDLWIVAANDKIQDE